MLACFVKRLRLFSLSRELDISDPAQITEGFETNIFVNRQDFLNSSIEEMMSMANDHFDPRHTLCVTYHGEGKVIVIL